MPRQIRGHFGWQTSGLPHVCDRQARVPVEGLSQPPDFLLTRLCETDRLAIPAGRAGHEEVAVPRDGDGLRPIKEIKAAERSGRGPGRSSPLGRGSSDRSSRAPDRSLPEEAPHPRIGWYHPRESSAIARLLGRGDDDSEPFEERMPRLVARLDGRSEESAK